MNGGRLALGLLGCLAVSALMLSLASLILVGNQSEGFVELHDPWGQSWAAANAVPNPYPRLCPA